MALGFNYWKLGNFKLGFGNDGKYGRVVSMGNNMFTAVLLDYGRVFGLVANSNENDDRYFWYLHDDKIMMLKAERKVEKKSQNILGKLVYREPLNHTHAGSLDYSQSGSGNVSITKKKTRQIMDEFVRPTIVQNVHSSMGTSATNWKQTTPFVDTYVTINDPDAPKYHIYSFANFFGPTGYWLTQSAVNVNFDEIQPVQLYINSVETPTIDYVLYNNGVEFSRGTTDANTIVISTWAYNLGVNSFSAVLSDSNGRSVTIKGPDIAVIYNRRPVVEWITKSGQHRQGHAITVSFHINDADSDTMGWSLYKNDALISTGTSSTGITIDHSLLLSGTNVFKVRMSDPYGTYSMVEGPTIKIVDWKQTSTP